MPKEDKDKKIPVSVSMPQGMRMVLEEIIKRKRKHVEVNVFLSEIILDILASALPNYNSEEDVKEYLDDIERRYKLANEGDKQFALFTSSEDKNENTDDIDKVEA